jgi:acylphosphatase
MHVLVSGFVQGVGFRYFVLTQALALGVTGWVRNTVGGEVEVMAQGDEAALRTLLEHLRRGPMRSGVSDTRIEWKESELNFRKFEIR